MQTSSHLLAGVCIGLACQSPPQRGMLLSVLLATEAPDLIEYGLYLGLRRQDILRDAIAESARCGSARGGYSLLKARWKRREFEGFWLHNLRTLTLLTPPLGYVLLRGSKRSRAVAGALSAHAAMDLYGDLLSVGHIRNWTRQAADEQQPVLQALLPAALTVTTGVLLLLSRRM